MILIFFSIKINNIFNNSNTIVDLIFNGGLVGSFKLPQIVVVSTDALIITNCQKNPSLSHTMNGMHFNRQSSYFFHFRFMVQYIYLYINYIDNRAVTGCCCCLFYFFSFFSV